MKKLLVYLHGFGFDKNNNDGFIKKLANKFEAELLSLDAPFESKRDRGGFAWYEIQKNPKKHIFDEKLEFSINYIIDETNKKLNELGLNWSNVILAGRSQGAFVSMYFALSNRANPNMVISLCGFYPDEILERGIINKKTKILWVEAKNDNVLTDDKKSSYKNLLKNNCNITYIVDTLSDHDNLNNSILELF